MRSVDRTLLNIVVVQTTTRITLSNVTIESDLFTEQEPEYTRKSKVVPKDSFPLILIQSIKTEKVAFTLCLGMNR